MYLELAVALATWYNKRQKYTVCTLFGKRRCAAGER